VPGGCPAAEFGWFQSVRCSSVPPVNAALPSPSQTTCAGPRDPAPGPLHMARRKQPPAHRHCSESWEQPASGDARLLVVADTHSNPHPATDERIAELRPDAILHAGDIGDLAVLDALRRHAPLFAVRGNIDARVAELPDSLDLMLTLDGEPRFSIFLTHIALYGPKLLRPAAERAHRHSCSLVVCGHSHVPFLGRDKGLTVFNPGSIGPRRFHLPITMGLIALEDSRLSVKHIDVETGEVWLP